MSVVVIGGNGFVGTNVLKQLVKKGVPAVSISRSGTLPKQNEFALNQFFSFFCAGASAWTPVVDLQAAFDTFVRANTMSSSDIRAARSPALRYRDHF